LRIVLIGGESDRARLRPLLADRGMEIVAEAATLAEGRTWAAEADALMVATAPAGEKLAEPITPRELEVLELLAEGLSNSAIASRLSISAHTVKFHVSSICAKLGAENRTDAVRRGVRLGIITL
jgi:DNA-binding NarL/FixJ family response regulator